MSDPELAEIAAAVAKRSMTEEHRARIAAARTKRLPEYESEAYRSPRPMGQEYAALTADCLIHPNVKTVARKVYILRHGPMPFDKPCVLHHCDRPTCIEDTHHYPGTVRENAADASRRGKLARSETYRRKMGEMAKGNQYWLGRQHSEETRRKIAMAATGRKLSPETRIKLSVAAKKREAARRNALGAKP